MTIKTFKGLLADDTQDKIHLAGGDSTSGYRIVKFELYPFKPGTVSQESLVTIWKVKQTTILTTVDFNDDSVLGSGYLLNHTTATDNPAYMDVVFDREVVNQDIYITHNDVKGTESVNYYLELEEIKMPDGETAVVNFNAALLHGN